MSWTDERIETLKKRGIGIGLALGPAGAGGLALEGIGEHRGDAVSARVREIEEVAGHL